MKDGFFDGSNDGNIDGSSGGLGLPATGGGVFFLIDLLDVVVPLSDFPCFRLLPLFPLYAKLLSAINSMHFCFLRCREEERCHLTKFI